jgi:serine protease Do
MLATLWPAAAQAAPADTVPRSKTEVRHSFAPLVKKTGPAVVNIYAKRVVRQRFVSPFFNDPFFGQFFGMPDFGGQVRERVESSLGSGVIVDAKGLIATNTHVIQGAVEIRVVTADGREFDAEKVLMDARTDLAILKIDPANEALPYLDLADSDTLEVGDLVLAIGNPFGIGQTVTSGIVSGLARTGVGPTDYRFFIQTDAAINPGNSGGALVDVDGKLIGINTMIFSRDGGSLGIGFAIPANMVATVIQASRSGGGRIIRPWTGVNAQPVTPELLESLGLNRARGALITRVHPQSPAARAGMKSGDVIISVNGHDIQDPEAMQFRMATVAIGTDVHLMVLRGGKSFPLTMKAEAPPEIPARDTYKIDGNSPLSGTTVENISPAVADEVGLAFEDAGVAVTAIENGSPAARLGLQIGDVIQRVNGADTPAVLELKTAIGASTQIRRWQVMIKRGTQVLNLMITL